MDTLSSSEHPDLHGIKLFKSRYDINFRKDGKYWEGIPLVIPEIGEFNVFGTILEEIGVRDEVYVIENEKIIKVSAKNLNITEYYDLVAALRAPTEGPIIQTLLLLPKSQNILVGELDMGEDTSIHEDNDTTFYLNVTDEWKAPEDSAPISLLIRQNNISTLAELEVLFRSRQLPTRRPEDI